MEFHLITVVWGISYLDSYLKVDLPLQLCPGNLGAFKNRNAIYRIFTTTEDKKIIQQSSVYKKLESLIRVDFIEIQRDTSLGVIEQMNSCHQLAIMEAAKMNAALIFLSPDCLLSNHAFANLLRAVENGYRVVMVPSTRIEKEKIVPLFEQLLHRKDIQEQGVTSRELVALSLPYLHGIIKSSFWGKKTINSHPSYIYWMLDEKNILTRVFHLHPLLVWPGEGSFTSVTSIDDKFVLQACPKMEMWKVIEDSDEMAIFEFSDKEHEIGRTYLTKCDHLTVAIWAQLMAAQHHCSFFQKKIYLKSTDRTAEWAVVERQSDKVVRNILMARYFAKPLCLLQKMSRFCKKIILLTQAGRFLKKLIRGVEHVCKF